MKKVTLISTGLVTMGVVAAVGIGVASAAASTSASVGSSGIPRNIFQQERQAAIVKVLNTSAANVQTAQEKHTLEQLIKNAGLTDKIFDQQLKTQLTSELESKGYSQDQIVIALQHKEIVRLHHKAQTSKKGN